ncbi:DNA-binding protein [Aeromonas jandaei]|uniref:DNA-binding protein n=1 Tax=Aeromonas jandaei TaxID=650 RepID=UPI001ADD7471|nr:DNA-binding protein [Aeromonas jandaei]QTL95560.1 hypothetical protein AjGTCBM29_03479 [Aeromonas jandaei]
MTPRSKIIRIPSDVSELPADYPFFSRETGKAIVSESLAEYADRQGEKTNTIRRRADRGLLPILQDGRRGHRRVNLYALYLQARYQAERFVTMTVAS